MSQSIQFYVTETYTCITVANGASRQTSGHTLPQVVEAMPVEDRATLARTLAWTLRMIAKLDGPLPIVDDLNIPALARQKGVAR